MIYKMKLAQYQVLKGSNMNHEDIINYVNDNLGFVNIRQTSLNAVDHLTNTAQRISVKPIRIITDVITY